ncbi:non-hydrolyzing UDP-N-acetylglucosamine 2-epimerase [Desulfomonile tiedjei]|uniref:UDP-N-acetylglucosamine 2-epimerase (non-hydrolyzing) n=1 Tax=Desulfomonile tiedjei (strain ATCC 49306 / DSM 6799 / DCB-1) TaxID=706587 RepID=I4C280_DESTA|nr:UDP-N-acetylglucosamine 2-epimerase (non-hydrolyzing) [Desulfomonile tiedjei]AFM23671.1 UDP-N-Acetylglucosamine 2-epimerase [Desulfomonile tiedjei DSM 6799]
MIKVLLAFGTRPEAIKLAPLYKELRNRTNNIQLVCCITGQHRELLLPFLDFFGIQADYDLNILKENQGLVHITSAVLGGMEKILSKEKPDMVIVQGDTSSAFAASLAAFYAKIPVGHVEAGLRSYDRFQPFPEEVNRVFISHMADLNFCPTQRAADNLIKEQVSLSSIFITGNTVIDALYFTLKRLHDRGEDKPDLENLSSGRVILVTAHRRESFGEGLRNLSLALRDLADTYDDVVVVYSVHPNPNVRQAVESILKGHDRIRVIPPPGYLSFVKLMKASYLIITDSGGIQEEAPSLNKPVLIARNVTERPEAVECGAARVVGTDRTQMVQEASKLLNDPAHYRFMTTVSNPFGDGHASERIADAIEAFFGVHLKDK